MYIISLPKINFECLRKKYGVEAVLEVTTSNLIGGC